MKNLLFIFVIFIGSAILRAQSIPLDPDPCWSYTGGAPHYIGLGDINNDGYLDLAVANEMFPVYVFINNGGVFPDTPSWQSSDTQPSFALSLGDYDNDGDLDLVVGGPYIVGGKIKLYENVNGTLNPNSVWASASKGAMDIAWGDVDGDGDLDLAAVDMLQYPCVFINDNGSFTPEPNWEANDWNNDVGATWFDVDMDGDLDLAVTRNRVRIFYNTNGVLENSASWWSEPPDSFEVGSAPAGDINMDGWLDLFSATGTTVDPSPDYLYMNINGTLELTPSWVSGYPAQTWKAVFGDIDGDGDLEVACSPFGDVPFVFINDNGSLLNFPAWFGNVDCEPGIALGDVDNDGIVQTVDTIYGNDTLKLFYLSHYPIHKLDTIKVDYVPLPLSDYCYVREFGWFSLKNAPGIGSIITVQYSYSIDMELAVGGVYLYNNINADISEKPSNNPVLKVSTFPDPFSEYTKISFSLPSSDFVSLKIFDCSGRLVKRWDNYLNKGKHSFIIGRDLKPGVYFSTLKIKEETYRTKIVKVKGGIR